MELTREQLRAIMKAMDIVAEKKAQATIYFMMEKNTLLNEYVVQTKPDVGETIKRRCSVYHTLFAWEYYNLCINNTGLEGQDVIDAFFKYFIDLGSDDDALNMSESTIEEANKIKSTCPKLASYLFEQAQDALQGESENFEVMMKRAAEIETHI
tara:strand:- start:349 stop:810 length:462 start_codon:yes stop_codon:yes gene_type:complete